MTSPADPPRRSHTRGEQRKTQLVRAGVEVLLERGWAGLTARAVAERAGAQLGLIHYHFGGFPELKRTITATVLTDAFSPVLAAVADARPWSAGLVRAITEGVATVDGPGGRLSAELVAASLQDEEVRRQVAEALAVTRTQLAAILEAGGVDRTEAVGLATTAVALLDGLMLHRLLDPGLEVDPVVRAVERLA